MPGPVPPQKVLIVGAGEFGSCAALGLAEGAYKGQADLITVVERGAEPPAIDAASSDYNKVRADYADPLYQELALEAIAQWRTERWAEHFHECGVICASATADPQIQYIRNSHRLNAESKTGNVSALEKGQGVKGLYKEGIPTGDFEGTEAYHNRVGGWAASRDAVVHAINLSRSLGVKFLAGEASSLITSTTSASSKPVVKGVRLVDGRTLKADVTILATGSWTPKLLPELATSCLPTGQTVATIILSEEEREKYKDMPVSLFMDTGFYCFPPTKDGVLKMAIHDRGWLAPTSTFPSLPRTVLSKGYEGQQIPRSALEAIKRGMQRVHPELAGWVETKLGETRLCWYSDRESGDFLFDYHPSYAAQSLFVAAGGSGHAFKFMPLLPSFLSSALSNSLNPTLKRLWSFYGDKSRLDKSRGEGPIVRRDLDTGKVAMVKAAEQELIKAKL
ncbi:hypothetical protein JCM10213_002643 [Rhodosporidiobolus nylandii]